MSTLVRQHGGRVAGTQGDNLLAEFASVVDAVRCAVVTQTTLKAENADLPPQRRVEFRMGINLGDVIVGSVPVTGTSRFSRAEMPQNKGFCTSK